MPPVWPAQSFIVNHPHAVTCKNCALYHTAQALGLEQSDCSMLNDVVLRDHPVVKDEVLYKKGEPFRYLYLIHSGACASYGSMASGTDQVMGYYLPGEIAGISAIGQAHYSHTIVALEKGSICRLDYSELNSKIATEELLRVQNYLLRAAASYAQQLQWERSLMGLQTAEQRVTAFLLNLLARLRQRGLPWQNFRLPMSRSSMSEYLGLASETVIRVLQTLQNRQLITIKAKQISILNEAALEAVLIPSTD
jgi:CRP/FNR family transcriptional regulator